MSEELKGFRGTPFPWTIIPPVPYDGEEEEFEGAFTVPASIEGADGNPVCMFGDCLGSGTLYENEADHRFISEAYKLALFVQKVRDFNFADCTNIEQLNDEARNLLASVIGE